MSFKDIPEIKKPAQPSKPGSPMDKEAGKPDAHKPAQPAMDAGKGKPAQASPHTEKGQPAAAPDHGSPVQHPDRPVVQDKHSPATPPRPATQKS